MCKSVTTHKNLTCLPFLLQVLDVRSELDLLDSLIQTPLVACGPGPYTPFLTTAPRLLAATTGVAAFQAQLQALLLGQGPLAAPSLLAVLRAGQ